MNAPKLTLEQIQDKIIGVDHHVFPGTTVTVCLLKLRNGYTVTGESACVSPENFDKALGEKYAQEDAVKKLWSLEGYLLKERLFGQAEMAKAGFKVPLEMVGIG